MARYDFYLLDAENSFWANFFKGAVGLWFRLCLVIILAVAAQHLPERRDQLPDGDVPLRHGPVRGFHPGGGHWQELRRRAAGALVRLSKGEHPINPLEQTAPVRVVFFADDLLRWGFRRFLNLVPDIDRYDWTDYVAQGFDISVPELVAGNGLLLVGYLLPWSC